ncbi:Autophagy protein 7 [Allomyces arbusculus]|nr:Autophagy protein 7 [Allomyces arbusculus]
MQFQTLTSVVEPTFWHALAELKLDVLKLDDSTVPLTATLEPGTLVQTSEAAYSSMPACISLDRASLLRGLERADAAASPSARACRVPGILKNVNTIEDFKALDKPALFASVANTTWQSITSGIALTDPTELVRFLLVAYADLKKHKFYYWFGFPALTALADAQVVRRATLVEEFGTEKTAAISSIFRDHIAEFAFLLTIDDAKNVHYAPFKDITTLARDGRKFLVAFVDPSSLADSPGWPLRNLLTLLAHLQLHNVKILCGRNDLRTSRTPDGVGQQSLVLDVALGSLDIPASVSTPPAAVGWERHPSGKLAPRVIDLSHMMDPQRLAESAVHLNLKLMKWRVLPELDLDAVSGLKCLLLGAGTLGCYVARTLLAWGVRHITLVDNGKVSFSNPVRQPLFTFDDCLNGGVDKAPAAARHLKQIFPGVIVTGHVMSIPMPGHPVLNEAEFRTTLVQLEEMVKAHDVVFLLMDSRESRWLPTLLGAVHDKIVINAALGFDSYVVMRHSRQLGCYYCNDVVAPTDSLSFRTLDQMCTVTRPGLAAIAGAHAVELLASLVNHPDRQNAPATAAGILGKVPHQIRGFLAPLETMLISGQAYHQCTACSESVRSVYSAKGPEFVRDVCNNPKALEAITGLDKLREAVDDLAWSEGEDGDADADDF